MFILKYAYQTCFERDFSVNSERTFWKGVLNSLNPQWSIELGRDWTPERGSVASNDFCMYVVDVKTGWMGCGALPQSEMRRLIQEAPKAGLSASNAHDAAAQLICEAADGQLRVGAAEYESTILMAALGITRTKTFAVGLRQNAGSMAGHWLYVVYRTKSGEFFGRPAMIQTEKPGLASPDVVTAYVRHVIKLDLTRPDSSVGAMLRQCGGTTVAGEFQ